MNTMTPEEVCSAIWKRLFHCNLVVLSASALVVLRLAYVSVGPDIPEGRAVEMAFWRVALLMAFQSAPLAWAHLIYQGYKQKLISIPLYQTTTLLRMPLAIWAGGCLITGTVFWPVLSQ
ncbi:hypothetical protein E8E95_07940 [Pseudomonas sp. BN414]|uniref:hypothetical protein n=1 Tax=Pseudomonas sp. BN414 TaxID=2567888 RepID=UPI00245432FD|nr:hypothetical protein [Pseudomonas sp. BN414]MDH4566607.1 hypothetical protein [Pseudomonas sp. BN414]